MIIHLHMTIVINTPLIRFTISSASLDRSPSGLKGLSQPESVLKRKKDRSFRLFIHIWACLVVNAVKCSVTTLHFFFQSSGNDIRSLESHKHSTNSLRVKIVTGSLKFFGSFSYQFAFRYFSIRSFILSSIQPVFRDKNFFKSFIRNDF